MNLYFILIVLKQINAVEIFSEGHMLKDKSGSGGFK